MCGETDEEEKIAEETDTEPEELIKKPNLLVPPISTEPIVEHKCDGFQETNDSIFPTYEELESLHHKSEKEQSELIM